MASLSEAAATEPAPAAAAAAMSAPSTAVANGSNGASVAVQSSPFIREVWAVQGPLLRASFNTLHTGADVSALCDRLNMLMQRGVYKHMEAELPSMFALTGRPHAALAQILAKMEPRIAASKRGVNGNGNGNGNGSGSTPAKGPKQADEACSTPVQDACPCPCPIGNDSQASDDWFTALLSRCPLKRIGSAHHHSLQVLLLTSVAKLCNGTGDAADEEGPGCAVPLESDIAFARDVLVPRWFAVPAVLQHVLTLYHLRLNWPQQRAYFVALQQARYSGDAAAWLVHWGSTCHVDPEELLLPLLRRSAPPNSEIVAIELAQACPDLRDPLVRMLTRISHRSPTSLKCIQRWRLDVALYPEVTHDLATRQLRWLVREGKAEELGPDVCGESEELRRALVQELISAGEMEDAQTVLDMFSLQGDAELTGALQQAQAARAADPSSYKPSKRAQALAAAGPFLQLPPSVPIVFVTASDPASLSAAEAGLSDPATDLVGLDVEFGSVGAAGSAPALLQISTRHTAFLFDLLCFDQCPRMASMLRTLFRSSSILKVGYAWDGDWRVLHQGFPAADCFTSQTHVLDMADPARALDRLEAIRDARIEAEARRIALAAEAEAAAAAAGVSAVAEEGVDPLTTGADAGSAPSPSDPSPSPDLDDSMGADLLAADDLDESEAAATVAMEDDAEEDEDDNETQDQTATADSADAAVDAASAPSSSSGNSGVSVARARLERRRAKKAAKKSARSPPAASGGASAVDSEAVAPIRKGVARGLSALAHLCLGLPLDKHFQISAWRRRPLKPAQMHYAALDAWCLIGIHDAFFGVPRLPLLDELGLPGVQTYIQNNPTCTGASAATAKGAEPQ